MNIVPKAVSSKLNVLEVCRKNEYNRKSILEKFSLKYCFTLVLHPVAMHQDNFGKNHDDDVATNSSLENNICFKTKGIGRDLYGASRYGAGKDYCVFNWRYGKAKKAAALARSNRASVSLANHVDHELENEDSLEVNNGGNVEQQAHHFGHDDATQTNQ